jgi:ABC-type dipeptide/oligopeptide/nickel transport system permease component
MYIYIYTYLGIYTYKGVYNQNESRSLQTCSHAASIPVCIIYIYKLYMISKVFKAIFCGVLQSLMVRKEEADKVRATP